MKQIRLILLIVLSAICSLSVNASPIFRDQFQNYNSGSLGNAGIGSENGWNTPRSHIVITNGSGSLDGTGLGLVASAGDLVYILPTANTNDNFDTNATTGLPVANGSYNKFVGSGTFPPTTNVNLYCSFLYRLNDNTNFPASGQSQLAALYLQSSGAQSNPNQGYWQLFARSAGGNNVQLGIQKNAYNATAGAINWDSTTIPVGQTFFVVVRLQIAATNGTSYYTNDIVDLWIDPPANTFGTNEASVPTPDVSSPAGDGAVPSSGTGPGRFFVNDNGPSANFDELRISTNWADVTPWFGQCQSATNGFTTQPTNVTQSAEISASFFVGGGNSSAPTFQWQISKDGGTTWSNIPGAVRSSLTTTNLQLATDNGNKYRAIMNVSCDNSSATSSVATVTLTAPVVTPSPSLIMDDTFADGDRSTGPVTANNSVWWTSVPANLDAFPGDTGVNGLVGTPITNTSSLFLGYFVNDITNRQPVHLAVGTQITAILNFIPDGFTHLTNNGALRFGMFDYADGGTFATGDNNTGPTSLTGSAGMGTMVRGYMLSLDFGTNFTSDTPMSLYSRNNLQDANLMGTTGDYIGLGDGPLSGSYSNVASFQAGTTYTLAFTVARVATNTSVVTATITGGTLNLSFTATDTNNFGYHRFDSFVIRPNKLENAADRFIIPEFKVLVTNAPPQVATVSIKSVARAGGSVTLTWQAAPGNADLSSGFSVYSKTNLTSNWNLLQSGIVTTNYTDTTATNGAGFYRVSFP